MKRLTLQTKLMLAFTSILLVTIFLIGIITIPSQLHSYDTNLDNTLTLVSNLVSQSNDVKQALIDNKVDKKLSDKLDNLVNDYINVDYVVLANRDSIRIYHPNHDLIGQKFAGDDQGLALQGSDVYLTTRYGSQASQRRALSSVYDDNNNVIGFVLASSSLTTIQLQKRNIIIKFVAILIITLLLGIILSYLISRNIKNILLGNDPDKFVSMYLQRQEILNHLNDYLIALDTNLKIIYTNANGKKMIKGKYLTKDFPCNTIINETFIKKKSSSEVMIEWQEHNYLAKCVLLDENNVLLIIKDQTEYVKVNQQLLGTNHIIDALRANTHEFLNKLHVIYGLLQVGETQEAINFITSVSNDIENNYQNVIKQIKNKTVAALILGKISHAKELGIQLNLRADSYLPLHSNYLSSQEFVTIVGNLIENAFDAVKNQPELRQVGLFIGENENGLTISVDDTGYGMTQQ